VSVVCLVDSKVGKVEVIDAGQSEQKGQYLRSIDKPWLVGIRAGSSAGLRVLVAVAPYDVPECGSPVKGGPRPTSFGLPRY
jgi:hypothetical protein